MRLPMPPQSRFLKRFLPRTLLGRSLLIILVPLVLVQAVALQIFYGSHLNLVSRRFAAGVAGEIATTIDLLERLPPDQQAWVLQNAWDRFEIGMKLEPGATLPRNRRPTLIRDLSFGLTGQLREKVGRPFTVDWQSDPQSVLVRIQLGLRVGRSEEHTSEFQSQSNLVCRLL